MRIVHPLIHPDRARVDAGFLDPRYPAWRREAGLTPAEHPGVDYNLTGTAGDADEGWPVVAIADGVVRSARAHRVWGNVVLIEHPEVAKYLGLPYLASQYAHLKFITVTEGARVWAGEPVGSVGKGDPRAPFLAHLHFEIRREPLPPDHWPGMDREAIRRGYFDPVEWLKRHLDPRPRHTREELVLYYGPGKKKRLQGLTVVNLEDPRRVHVRTEGDLA